MLQRLLIANRGEIALRIIRTCRKLGIETVAVFSEADAQHAFVGAATTSVALGGTRADESYLSIDKILAAAAATSADAIHPGYGFLSENAEFAERAEAAGIVFVGPTPAVLRELGEKDRARKLAQSLGIPTPAGYDQPDQSLEAISAAAQSVGYPMLLKAAAGGGGRGMRRVDAAEQLAEAIASAKREALSSFGDDRLIVEKLVLPARHIEVQLLGDGTGNVLHFFERDCSWQRRYQKVFEEAPARALPAETREALLRDAVKLAAHAKLRSAATAEFLVSPSDGKHYFLEVNPRLQVEHPVTELACGVDLVELQLRVAAGEPLNLTQNQVAIRGCAIEARVYAEIPELGFIPSTGRALNIHLPEHGAGEESGVRIDHALVPGMKISAFYDPLLAKVIGFGPSHIQARAQLVGALSRIGIGGIGTNAGFLVGLMNWSNQREIVYTDDLEKLIAATDYRTALAALSEAALCWHVYAARCLPAVGNPSLSAFFADSGDEQPARYRIECASLDSPLEVTASCTSFYGPADTKHRPGGALRMHSEPLTNKEIAFEAAEANPRSLPRELAFRDGHLSVEPLFAELDEHAFFKSVVNINGYQFAITQIPEWEKAEAASTAAETELRAPLPGVVAAVPAVVGAAVQKGDVLVVLESMKMEHSIRAPQSAVVEAVLTEKGTSVQRGATLVRLRPQ